MQFSLVDTWDFQAKEFYLKNGYEKIGELKNYWHGHSKLFLLIKHRVTQSRRELNIYWRLHLGKEEVVIPLKVIFYPLTSKISNSGFITFKQTLFHFA
jgi:hypothetical protein